VITEFSAGLTPNSVPIAITAGPDGNLWFTEQSGNRIGVITPTGVIVELSVPTPNSEPRGITAGPGGIWFTESDSTKIGRVRVTGATTDVVTGAGAGGGPHVQVLSGADGHVLRSFFPYDPGFTGGVRVGSCDSRATGCRRS
jgi:virginiamycin B lyase